MQPVPLSACNHWQGGHSRLKKTQQRTGYVRGTMENMQWQSGGRKNQKKKKKNKRGGKKEPLFPFYGPVREEKGFWVTPCRRGWGGGSPFACRWGMSQSVHAYMSVTEWWGEKNGRERGEKGLKKKVGWQEGGRGLFKRKRLPTAFILLLV